MKKYYLEVICATILGLSFNVSSAVILKETDWKGPGFSPKNGFVPDKKTAVSIAIAVLSPIYGRRIIVEEQPFIATLKKDVWMVRGSLQQRYVGGVAEIQISKATGQVLKVSHTK